jgi:peptidase S41-like protein
MTVALLVASCTSTPAGTASGSPSRTIDIKRTRLDIVYSAFVDQDVHHVTSKKALEAALEAVKAAVRGAGGKDDVPTPQFQDVDEPQTADFNKFADAVSLLAGRVQLSSERIANAALVGMLGTSPDCHTFYVAPGGGGIQSRPFAPKGSSAIIPAQGTSLGAPDEAGLTGRMLPGGIAYITFRDWMMTGTYHLDETVRAMLDKAVAQGAKAWLFDLRGNMGGFLVDFSSFFLNGEPTRGRLLKTGNGGTSTSNTDLRLPEAYQLPIAVIANDRSASASEHFILDLKEGKRATLVGQKTYGCLGAAIETHLPDGGLLSVVVEEVIGGTSGARYNNLGIPPDVQADDPTAVAKAIEILNQKIAGR